MASALSVDDLFPDEANRPINFDPYHGDCPKIVLRSMRTPAEVIVELKQMAFIRNMSLRDIAVNSGLDLSTVTDLVEYGKGDMNDLFNICSVLGIEPVLIPFPQMLKKGAVSA